MNQRLSLVLWLCAPMAAAGCFLQPLDPEARTTNEVVKDGGLTTVTQTPPIEFDGGSYTSACDVVTSQATAVLEKYCARCHSGRDEGAHRGVPPFDFLFNFEKLKTAPSSVADLRDGSKKMRFVAAGDPDNSRLYLRVARGEMPPPDVVGATMNPRPTVSDISLLREWISSCMGNTPPPTPIPPAVTNVDGGRRPDAGVRADAGRNDAPAGGGGGMGARIALSSPDLMEGGIMPLASSNPTNQSPPLSWSNAPAGTRSFAVALTAVDGATVLWVLWDIPANVTQLPRNIGRTTPNPPEVMGASQRNYQGADGYIGPAANNMAAGRNYKFDIWALDVERLNTGGLGLGQGGGARDTQQLVDAIRMRAFPGTFGTINLKGNPGN
jgi:Raf kinase inhibitor-like YbhB/YbcL family protein